MKKFLKLVVGSMFFILFLWSILSLGVCAEEDANLSLSLPLTTDVQLQDLSISISIIYDGAYYENILLPGQEMTLELYAHSTSSEQKKYQFFVGFMNSDGNLIDIALENFNIGANETKTVTISKTVPQDEAIASAVVYVWDNLFNKEPHIPFSMRISGTDYFGDDCDVSQPLSAYSTAVGTIHSANDTDMFTYTATEDGLYVFESQGTADTYANLYAQDNTTTPIASDDNSGEENNFRIAIPLQKGKKYYLKVQGHGMGDYKLTALYAINSIYGNISPVVYDSNRDFFEEIETKVTLTTYDTNDFVAAMHLKEWTVAENPTASFNMTGIHSGTYLVSITRPGYLTWYRKIELSGNSINLGTVVLLAGDVDGNGIINSSDIPSQSLQGKQYGQAGYNIAADLNGDKIINAADSALITPNLGKNANSYSQDINCITVSASRSGSALNITGTARPNSTVTVNVYRAGTAFDSQDVNVSSSGTYSATCNLSRAGKYDISVTADNRAVDAAASINY